MPENPGEDQRSKKRKVMGAGEPKTTEKLEAIQQELESDWNSPSLMVLFDGGDLNKAMDHLLASLQNPFAEHAVATLFIQESVREPVIKLLVEQLKPLEPQIYNHPNYVRSRAKLQQLRSETIVGNPKTVPAHTTPMLVCDISHKFLGDGPTGIITMHTFRTPKDAIQAILQETLAYGSVSIWHEKIASAYEMCDLLKNDTFMINCFNVDLAPIRSIFKAGKNDTLIEGSYHYEILTKNEKSKIVVSVVGSIFAK